MIKQFLTRLKSMNEHGLPATAILAIAPLLIAATATIRISYGDFEQAMFIFSEVGIATLWLQGIGAVIINVMQAVAVVGVWYSVFKLRKSLWYLLPAAAIGCLGYFITPISTALSATVFLAIYWYATRKSDEKLERGHAERVTKIAKAQTKEELEEHRIKMENHYKQVIEKNENHLKAIVLGLIAIVFVSAILAYPQIPQSNLTIKKVNVSGLVLKRDASDILLYNTDNKTMERYHSADIEKEVYCKRLKSPNTSFTGKTGFRLTTEFLGAFKPLYGDC